MKSRLIVLVFLLLTGCRDETSDKEAAARRETAKREETLRKETASQELHHTLRILIFALLAGGSAVAWMRLAYSARRPGPFDDPAASPPALENDRPQVRPQVRRVIDPPRTRHPP